MNTVTAVDMFCGAGGASNGLQEECSERGLGLELLAINHWPTAIDTHRRNHPAARHLRESLDNVDPRVAVPGLHLNALLAGPECPHHSNARGARPMNEQSRASVAHVTRWLEQLRVDAFAVENVPNFKNYGPLIYDKKGNARPDKKRKGETYKATLRVWESMGFTVEDRELVAANYGDPTTRRRLVIIGKRRGAIRWPEPTHSAPGTLFMEKQWRPARDVIDWSLEGTSIFTRRKPLAEATLKRIEVGLKRFGWAEPFLVILRKHADAQSLDESMPAITTSGTHFYLCEPFLIEYYGSSTVSPISEPVPTVTTRDRFALIDPIKTAKGYDIRYRMLTSRELARAQGFPDTFQFCGSDTDIKRQIGNAWPNGFAKAVCSAVLS